MESGAKVDVVSLRPKQQADPERRASRKAQSEAELRAQAEDLALGVSEEGERFKDLLLTRLEHRLLQLIQDDPEAQGYLGVLKDMGHKFNAAKVAVDKLYQANMGIGSA